MEKTIIFLDIDGVLNQLQRNYFIDIDCVEVLAELCKNINGEIVLSSTWRLGYSNIGKSTPQVEKLKHIFESYGIKIVGRTPKLGDRAEEITKFIQLYGIDKYLILDDDKREFLSGLLPHTFIVNNRTGLKGYKLKDILKALSN
mgnify:CR=1 FL=1